MKKKDSEGKEQKAKLPPEFLSVDYPPATGSRQIPVRGGKRAPNQADRAAEAASPRETHEEK